MVLTAMRKSGTLTTRKTRYKDVHRQLNARLDVRTAGECRLGREPIPCRHGRCSRCVHRQNELEVDQAIERLVEDRIIVGSDTCPYRLAAGEMLVAITAGPEAAASLGEEQKRTLDHLSHAVKHLKAALKPFRDDPDFTRWLTKPYLRELARLATAEKQIEVAAKFIREKLVQSRQRPDKGRPEGLAAETALFAGFDLWRQWTGTEPGKSNATFARLVSAIWITLGGSDEEPNWEWYIRKLKQRLDQGGK
jgi:hypothetical protein